uniref:RCC1-like domain-containing protein n=1 Tax=Physcomitrium patens TaxID=3218 RepID=A0A7I4D5J0_PHYPA
MGGGIEMLPPCILQDILYNGRLGPVDLASLEASSYMFRAASGIAPYRFKSIAELAAHHSCQMHPVFENFPPRARLELLARCEGNWKLVLHFLNSLQRSSGLSVGGSGRDVLVAAGRYHTLLVDRKGELYACGTGGSVLGQNPAVSNLQRPASIPLPAAATRIVQISANFNHAAFVTESGQVYTFGDNVSCCCGVGESGQPISKPTLVTTLERNPCQQVSTGQGYTVALTRNGELFSWGCNSHGQLGQGNTQEQFRPRQIEEFNESNPVAQVSAGICHTLAVTKSGQLFSWGYGSNYCLGHDDFLTELRPKRVEHGGFDDLFIISAAAGDEHSAAIDSLGYVVARRRKTFVLGDNGTVHSFGWMAYHSLGVQGKSASDTVVSPQSLDLALHGHKVSTIAAGMYHTLVITRKGAIFGFGDNDSSQLGPVSVTNETPLAVRIPAEVFSCVTGVVQD